MNYREWWEDWQTGGACWCKGATTTQLLLLAELERYEHRVAISCHLKARLHFQMNIPDVKVEARQTTSLDSFLNLLSGKENLHNRSSYPSFIIRLPGGSRIRLTLKHYNYTA